MVLTDRDGQESAYLRSSIGLLRIEASQVGITALTISETSLHPEVEVTIPHLKTAVEQLTAYFAGELIDFDIPFDVSHASGFYRRVWEELRKIPYGTTITYGELAKRVREPKAAQAVGLANSKNPIAIIIPCHRVIGGSGALTGYAWGIDKKRWLLTHERSHIPVPQGQLF